jgi:hypothetical protein
MMSGSDKPILRSNFRYPPWAWLEPADAMKTQMAMKLLHGIICTPRDECGIRARPEGESRRINMTPYSKLAVPRSARIRRFSGDAHHALSR